MLIDVHSAVIDHDLFQEITLIKFSMIRDTEAKN